MRLARAALTPSPHLRRRAAAVTVLGVLLGGAYLMWLRDLPLVRVERVTVTGIDALPAREARRLRAALEAAGQRMTTLHLDRDALERATAVHPAVRALELDADFPHGLRIHVVRQLPVAALVAGDRRVAVAGDGSVLEGLPVVRLPAVEVEGGLPSGEVTAGSVRDAVRLAGAAPAALRHRLEAVERERTRGLVVEVRDGPALLFGDSSRLAAKWAAATRVLADPDADGAEYVDVRLPERPAAGGLVVETLEPVLPADDDGLSPSAPAAATSAEEAALGAPAVPEGPVAPAAPAEPAPAADGALAPPPVDAEQELAEPQL